MKKFPFIVTFVVGLALILTACGGSGGGAPSTSINVVLTDFQFSPNVFTVPAGAKISFTATNNGGVEHSFVIMKQGYQVKGHFTDADRANIYWSKLSIPVGGTMQDSFTAPSQPGEYQIVCEVGGHFEAGMIAKLVVVASK